MEEHSKQQEPAWVLYGAYGYTGKLILAEAHARGHRPLLAGRNKQKLAALAQQYNLPYRAVGLQETTKLEELLQQAPLVLHAAGPFVGTGEPMLRACLNTQTHYLDITGEPLALQRAFGKQEQARQRGVCVLPGTGFDVVPSDCLALYAAHQLQEVHLLELAFETAGGAMSPGTMRSTLEALPHGGSWRSVGGRLARAPLGEGMQHIRFSHGKRRCILPIAWGDIVTAHHSTGAHTVVTHASATPQAVQTLRLSGGLLSNLLKVTPLRRAAQQAVRWWMPGPSEADRKKARSYFWAQAADTHDNRATAWLEAPEGYTLTARTSVRMAERVLAGAFAQPGVWTPAQAFGPDFILEFEDVLRYDELPRNPAPA